MRIFSFLTILGFLLINNPICISGWSKEDALSFSPQWSAEEDIDPIFDEPMTPDPYLDELRELLNEYRNGDKGVEYKHLAIKKKSLARNNGGIYRPIDHYDWLKKNPKSVLIGSIAAVTLFLGLVLTVGIVMRRRYLINSMSKSGSLIGQEAGDKKLAHSAQMYHYQFQKQQILAMEKASIKNDQSEDEGTDVETDGDFTVYECSGAPKVNEVEVKNPLFTGKEQSDDGGNADDELINTSQNSDTYVEEKKKSEK